MTSTCYIVHDNNGVIHGYGQTTDEAYADMRSTMEQAGVQILEDDDDSTEQSGAWTRASGLKIVPATAALLALVESHGGDCSWDRVEGVACTRDEADCA